jgi:acyl carrier protein
MKLAECLGGDINEYDQITPIATFGLDSLSTIELISWINKYIFIEVQPSFIDDSITVEKLYNFMITNSIKIQPNDKQIVEKK